MPTTLDKVDLDEQVWVAYNHMPNGQIAITHFETEVRRKRIDDNHVDEVVFTVKEQIESFARSDFVALNMDGVLVKNRVLVYDGPQLNRRDPHNADRVIEWALRKGLVPKPMASEVKAKENDRVNLIDERVLKLEKKVDDQGSKIDQILEAVTAKK